MRRKLSTRLKIVGATLTAIFSLFSAFAATYAWFATNASVTATGMQISVATPPEVNFDFYYLSSFTDGSSNTQPGNVNTSTNINSGYEVDYQNATFTMIDFDNLPTPNPTDIQHLWPAHKLTFAIVIDSGDASKLTLSDWDEGEGNEAADAAMTNASQYVRLSWAIDIYGAAYNVTATGSKTADIATAYSSYYSASKTDVFTYSEANPADEVTKEELEVVNTIPAVTTGYRTIVLFTIEFSNADATFYRFNSATNYYVKDTSGNSNCYEGLALGNLKFAIK